MNILKFENGKFVRGTKDSLSEPTTSACSWVDCSHVPREVCEDCPINKTPKGRYDFYDVQELLKNIEEGV